MNKDMPGWGWFDAPPVSDGDEDSDVAGAFARCFRGLDGEQVMTYLASVTLHRPLGPGAPDQALRHLEGQRQLVAHMLALIKRGGGVVSTPSPMDNHMKKGFEE